MVDVAICSVDNQGNADGVISCGIYVDGGAIKGNGGQRRMYVRIALKDGMDLYVINFPKHLLVVNIGGGKSVRSLKKELKYQKKRREREGLRSN